MNGHRNPVKRLGALLLAAVMAASFSTACGQDGGWKAQKETAMLGGQENQTEEGLPEEQAQRTEGELPEEH
ncbi:MAG: hypothetical protein K2P19_01900, partial [Kineothrix sp.]|nr:hypothetical protein [Kineothrix sp.]